MGPSLGVHVVEKEFFSESLFCVKSVILLTKYIPQAGSIKNLHLGHGWQHPEENVPDAERELQHYGPPRWELPNNFILCELSRKMLGVTRLDIAKGSSYACGIKHHISSEHKP